MEQEKEKNEKTEKTEKTEKNKKSSEREKLIEDLSAAKAQADEYKDKWMRSVAEFDNYKKVNATKYTDGFKDGVSSVIGKILVIGDNLEWALSLGLDEKTADGIEKLKKKYADVLTGLGLEEIDPKGQVFDPNIAEAVMTVPAEDGEKPDTVKQVFQKGYKLGEKIIRYATVSVIK